ncbi:MAG TPA: hypothetical protein DEA08_16595, partial [Planctomycetes bacterium]|nr:hypothetical protein [Planctomycetota bacterium]
MTQERDEALLSELLEGLLSDEDAAALEERCRDEPELARARAELERILADPVQLEPCALPESLEGWVRDLAADPPRAEGEHEDEHQDEDNEGGELLAGGLEPVEAPAHLREWVRERAAAAAERDPLAEPVELEQPAVPAHLAAWVSERARAAGAGAEGAGRDEREEREGREGRVLVFPRAALLVAAAALLVGLGLGLLG